MHPLESRILDKSYRKSNGLHFRVADCSPQLIYV